MVYEIRSLGLRSRRTIALALPGLAVAGFIVLFAGPFVERQAEHRAAVLDKLQVLQRYAAIAAYDRASAIDRPSMSDDAEAGIQYPDDDEALLLADLQGRIAQAAASKGVSLHSTQAIAGMVRDGLTWIGVEAAMIGPLAGMQRMLASLEQGAPRLFVRIAEFRADRSGGYDPSLGIVVSASLRVEASVQRKSSP